MNAIELSERISDIMCATEDDARAIAAAADMLCTQREAIKRLRKALTYASTYVQEDEAERGKPYYTGQVIRQALKDTEHLK